jgi:hypothetical protein
MIHFPVHSFKGVEWVETMCLGFLCDSSLEWTGNLLEALVILGC